jgi:hypothetical protein
VYICAYIHAILAHIFFFFLALSGFDIYALQDPITG